MKRQLLIGGAVVLVVLAVIGKLALVLGPEKPFTREGIHVEPTADGADASDGKFRIHLPAVPKVIRSDATTVAVGTRGARVDVLLAIVTPVEFDDAALPGVAAGFALGVDMTNLTWAPGTLAGLNAGTAKGDGTWEGKRGHVRLWAVAAPTQKRFYVLAAIAGPSVAPADLEQVASRLALVTP